MRSLTAVFRRFLLPAAAALAISVPAGAQVTPAAGYTPPDDTPSIKVGATIFVDWTRTVEPTSTDADGNTYNPTAFNVGRTYINITGQISHLVAFRITPDVTKESGSGSSINGSYTVRLKYGFMQLNLDQWMTKGSWARFGLQQTPWVDYEEGMFRYRFVSPIFVDREGYLTSSDAGASFHYNFAKNYGDVHVGYYNGNGYSKYETDSQKAFQARASIRPFPKSPVGKGLRVAGFYDADRYTKDGDKTRGLVNVSFEHKYLNVMFEYLNATDQKLVTAAKVKAKGYSIWATPKSPKGWEGLIRYDHLEPDTSKSDERNRTIVGVAYWFPHTGGPTAALMLDYQQTDQKNFTPALSTKKALALHALVNF